MGCGHGLSVIREVTALAMAMCGFLGKDLCNPALLRPSSDPVQSWFGTSLDEQGSDLGVSSFRRDI